MDARRFDEFSAKKCQKLVISPLLFTIDFYEGQNNESSLYQRVWRGGKS